MHYRVRDNIPSDGWASRLHQSHLARLAGSVLGDLGQDSTRCGVMLKSLRLQVLYISSDGWATRLHQSHLARLAGSVLGDLGQHSTRCGITLESLRWCTSCTGLFSTKAGIPVGVAIVSAQTTCRFRPNSRWMEINTVVSSESKRREISSDFALHLPWGMIYYRIKLYSEFWYTGRFYAK
jgi:hypothetical protein